MGMRRSRRAGHEGHERHAVEVGCHSEPTGEEIAIVGIEQPVFRDDRDSLLRSE